MADAITYADLRFVKVPLKNSASNHLGQGKSCLLPPPPIIFHPHSTDLTPDSDFGAFSFPDCEAYEDGELTYENVQVSPVPGGPPGLASPALADKAGRQGGPGTPTESVFIQGEQSSLGERSRAISENEMSESQGEEEWEVLTVSWVFRIRAARCESGFTGKQEWGGRGRSTKGHRQRTLRK